MSVARVTELSAVSDKGFEDAIDQAVGCATKTLRGVEGAWVKHMNVIIEDGNIVGYKVNVAILRGLDLFHAGYAASRKGTDDPIVSAG